MHFIGHKFRAILSFARYGLILAKTRFWLESQMQRTVAEKFNFPQNCLRIWRDNFTTLIDNCIVPLLLFSSSPLLCHSHFFFFLLYSLVAYHKSKSEPFTFTYTHTCTHTHSLTHTHAPTLTLTHSHSCTPIHTHTLSSASLLTVSTSVPR